MSQRPEISQERLFPVAPEPEVTRRGYISLTSIPVSEIIIALKSCGGKVVAAANTLGCCPANLQRLAVKNKEIREHTLAENLGDLNDWRFSQEKSITFARMNAVLAIAYEFRMNFRQIEQITGIQGSTIKDWIKSDTWFAAEWSKQYENFGADILDVVRLHALNGDLRAALECLKAEFPEYGYTKDKPREVTVNIQNSHETLLEALDEHRTRITSSS